MLDDLFDQAIASTGAAYAAARGEILRQGPAAVGLLSRNAGPNSPQDRQWVAEAMLARMNSPVEAGELEREFHEKVVLFACYFPDPTVSGTKGPTYLDGLFLPYEPTPYDLSPEGVVAIWKDFAPDVRDYYDSLRVRESELWGPLLGEVLLKGWQPATPVNDPRGPAKFPRRKQQPDEGDYEYQALVLLGKLNDDRAGHHALEILQDERRGFYERAVAAVTLGRLRYRPGVPTLLELCASGDAPLGVQNAAFDAVALMDDPGVVPELEEIAANPAEGVPRAEYTTASARARSLASKRAIHRLRGNRPGFR